MAADPDPDSRDDEGAEWHFSLEDIEKRNADDTGADDGDDEGGNIAGALSPDEEIEPGDIDVENAVFVLVGVALAALVLAGFATVLP